MKKIPGDIIILHKCIKDHDHMIYCSWDMAHDGCNCYFSFWAIFCPFTPLTTRKMKILKTYKKTPWDIIILYKCTQNHGHMLYYSWDMARDRCKCSFFYFGLFLPFYAPNSSKNQNFKKMKECLEISSFYTCVPKIMIRWRTVPEIWCATDGRTDGRTEIVTYRGGCPT